MCAKVISIARIRERPTRQIHGMRWIIVGLIFLATCINYIDRSSIGLLVTKFGEGVVVSVRRQRDALVGEIHGVANDLPGDPIGLLVSAVL